MNSTVIRIKEGVKRTSTRGYLYAEKKMFEGKKRLNIQI